VEDYLEHPENLGPVLLSRLIATSNVEAQAIYIDCLYRRGQQAFHATLYKNAHRMAGPFGQNLFGLTLDAQCMKQTMLTCVLEKKNRSASGKKEEEGGSQLFPKLIRRHYL
jgi:hypothetical protein